MPELCRGKGGLLLSAPVPAWAEAEKLFLRSLELSRSQGALAWQLRSAVDLATLWSSQGDPWRARSLLQPIHAQFSEGWDTADIRAAKRLLAMSAQRPLLTEPINRPPIRLLPPLLKFEKKGDGWRAIPQKSWGFGNYTRRLHND
jgi:hypothetical protein